MLRNFIRKRRILNSVSRLSLNSSGLRPLFSKTQCLVQFFVARVVAFICADFHTASSIRLQLKNFASLRWRTIGDFQATGQIANCAWIAL